MQKPTTRTSLRTLSLVLLCGVYAVLTACSSADD